MIAKLTFVLVVCYLGNQVSAQVVSFGKCPTVNVKANFDLNQVSTSVNINFVSCFLLSCKITL